METVEIVISLPKDLYKGIERRNGELETEYVCDELMKAIDNGILLPKRHGRLIDASQLLTVTECREDGTEYCYVPYTHIEAALTIIEADRTESEK